MDHFVSQQGVGIVYYLQRLMVVWIFAFVNTVFLHCKTDIFFQNSPKNQDPYDKMDLDLSDF